MNRKFVLVYIVNDIIFFKNHFLPVALYFSKTYNLSIVSDKIDFEIKNKYPEIKQYIAPIYRTSINPIIDLKLIYHLTGLINKIKPDIIHNITIKPILFGSFAVKIINPNIKIINSVTGLGYAITNNHFFIKSIMQILIRLFVSKKSHFLFLNKHDKTFYNKLGKGLNQNFTMIKGSGVDHYEFQYQKPLKKDKIEIIFTGRILYDKGVINLIDAINLLPLSIKAKIILKLYGSIDVQNPAHIKKKQIENYLVPGFIEWYGFTSEIKKVISRSDVYCLPSYREGIPKSTIEAMAIGRPILTTEAPGCEDTVEQGVNGFKVPVGNVMALSEKLQILIEDEPLRIQMGKQSREIFEKNYTLEKVIKQTFEVYAQVLRN